MTRTTQSLIQGHVTQGIVGSTPWNAMVFFTLWLQLLGFTDYSASVLMALFAGGCAIGSALGGYLGEPVHLQLWCTLPAHFDALCQHIARQIIQCLCLTHSVKGLMSFLCADSECS